MLEGWLAALEAAPVTEWLRLSSWAYAAVNTLHVVGIALLFGAIVPLDLRLAGWRQGDASLAALSRLLLPVSKAGFVLAALTGFLLFAADARSYAASSLFQAKLVVIVAALLNAGLLRGVDWAAPRLSNRRLAGAGAVSLLLWLLAIGLGRWIAYA